MKKKSRQIGRETVNLFTDFYFLRTVSITTVGCFIAAFGINGIVKNQNLLAGGFTGLSLGVYYLLERIPLGYIYFIVNLILIVIVSCFRPLAFRYMLTSFLGTIAYSVALIVTKDVQIVFQDPFNSLLFASFLIGVGYGIYLRYGGIAGGMDLLAMVVSQKFSIPMGSIFNAINAVIFLFGYIYYDLNTLISSAILLIASGFITVKVQSGFSERQAVYIITDKPDGIADLIGKKLHRGFTFFNGTKGYSRVNTKIIFTVINMRELGKLKELIHKEDADAFVTVFNTKEVIGKAFLNRNRVEN